MFEMPPTLDSEMRANAGLWDAFLSVWGYVPGGAEGEIPHTAAQPPVTVKRSSWRWRPVLLNRLLLSAVRSTGRRFCLG